MKTISILGSTGSIGKQTIDVISSSENEFKVAYLTVNTKIDELAKQIEELNPVGVAISDEVSYYNFKSKYSVKCKVLCGEEGVCEAASYQDNDIVMQSLLGFSGVAPTLAAINAGKVIALANKETLVSAGSVVMKKANESNVKIIPVDSEHNAIMQCLAGESSEFIEKIILTASGGPFLKMPIGSFTEITKTQALRHPNWSMGEKITIDSATLMNKGFEVIEAYWLFGLNHNQIDVVVHPQSIIHSLVQFTDGSLKAQLGQPDMRIPISYALFYPERIKSDYPRLTLTDIKSMEFYHPDMERFKCLKLAFEAMKLGGTAPVILNAANEIAVRAFLDEKISFLAISECIEHALKKVAMINNPDIDEIVNTDLETRKISKEYINFI